MEHNNGATGSAGTAGTAFAPMDGDGRKQPDPIATKARENAQLKVGRLSLGDVMDQMFGGKKKEPASTLKALRELQPKIARSIEVDSERLELIRRGLAIADRNADVVDFSNLMDRLVDLDED